MFRASGSSSKPQRIRKSTPDFLRLLSVKLSMKSGKVCNQTSLRKINVFIFKDWF